MRQDVDARNKSGHDEKRGGTPRVNPSFDSTGLFKNPVEAKPFAPSTKPKPDSSGTSPAMTAREHFANPANFAIMTH